MGVLYSAQPLDTEVRQWLVEEGLSVPTADGSPPTPSDLEGALRQLQGYSVTFNIGEGVWQALVSDQKDPENGPWTLLSATDADLPDQPCKFHFEKGSPELAIEIVHLIAQQCGPFVVVPDTGCDPAVVEPESTVEQIISNWAHLGS